METTQLGNTDTHPTPDVTQNTQTHKSNRKVDVESQTLLLNGTLPQKAKPNAEPVQENDTRLNQWRYSLIPRGGNPEVTDNDSTINSVGDVSIPHSH